LTSPKESEEETTLAGMTQDEAERFPEPGDVKKLYKSLKPKALSKATVKSIEEQRQENDNQRHKLARWLVGGIVIFLCTMTAATFFLSLGFDVSVPEPFDKLLQIIQAALFTFLGFLFGERSKEDRQ